MTLAEHLRAANALIDMPEKWTKNKEIACNPDGTYSYCMMGALERTQRNNRKAHRILCSVIDGASLTGWNDAVERTHTEVMAAFDRAIEIAEQQQLRS